MDDEFLAISSGAPFSGTLKQELLPDAIEVGDQPTRPTDGNKKSRLRSERPFTPLKTLPYTALAWNTGIVLRHLPQPHIRRHHATDIL